MKRGIGIQPPPRQLLKIVGMMNSLASSLMFPLELEREIFMTAAIIHEETIPTLLRVAHHVLVWQAVVMMAKRHC